MRETWAMPKKRGRSAKKEAPTERGGARQAKSQDDDLSANVLPKETKPEAFA
jgi:hypothetical protein